MDFSEFKGQQQPIQFAGVKCPQLGPSSSSHDGLKKENNKSANSVTHQAPTLALSSVFIVFDVTLTFCFRSGRTEGHHVWN